MRAAYDPRAARGHRFVFFPRKASSGHGAPGRNIAYPISRTGADHERSSQERRSSSGLPAESYRDLALRIYVQLSATSTPRTQNKPDPKALRRVQLQLAEASRRPRGDRPQQGGRREGAKEKVD